MSDAYSTDTVPPANPRPATPPSAASAPAVMSDEEFGIGPSPKAPPAKAVMSDTEFGLQPQSSADMSRLDQAKSMLTDIPSKIGTAFGDSMTAINNGLNPWSEARAAINQRKYDPNASITDRILAEWDDLKNTGAGLAAIPSAVFSPVTGVARSVIGHGYEAVTPHFTPEERSKLEAAGATLPTGDEVADTLMMAAAPGKGKMVHGVTPSAPNPPLIGATPKPFEVAPATPTMQWQEAPKTTPPPTPPDLGTLGVLQSEGQKTGNMTAIRREQDAARGILGDAAKERFDQFDQQQKAQLQTAGETVRDALDPGLRTVAETPYEAADLISQGVQRAKAASKANVDHLYETARSLPGSIDADVFQNIGRTIRNDLNNPPSGRNPVNVSPTLTRAASEALDYLDGEVAKLRIPNKAAVPGSNVTPTGSGAWSLSGVTLEGIDQWRRNLAGMRDTAFGINPAEGRAMQAVMDAFDNQVTKAVNSGAFKGDPAAVQAWNDARAAHADYRSKYFDQGTGDAVGKIMEKITGNKYASPMSTADLADKLYSASGTKPSTATVDLYKRLGDVLGQGSPEMSGVKQGLFSRLREDANGPLPPARISKNINQFLNGNGRDLANAFLTPSDRAILQTYGDLQKSLVVPQAGAQWSNNARFINRLGDKIGVWVGAVLGKYLLNSTVPFLGEATGALAAKQLNKIGQLAEARKVGDQMPILADQIAKYQKAMATYQKAGTPISRAGAKYTAASLARILSNMGIDNSDVESPQ